MSGTEGGDHAQSGYRPGALGFCGACGYAQTCLRTIPGPGRGAAV